MSAKEARQTLRMEINDLKKQKREIEAELAQREAMLKIVELMAQRAAERFSQRRPFAEEALERITSACDSSLWPQKIAELRLATVAEFMGGLELVTAGDWKTPLFKTATGDRIPHDVAAMLMQLYQPRRGYPKPLIGQSWSLPTIYFSAPAT